MNRRMVLMMIGVAIATRLPALLYPRPIDDEAVYGVVARVMLAGGMPYRDAIERKPPLLFAVYWAMFRLFGAYNWLALHVLATAWLLLTMAGLFVMTSQLGGRRNGMLAALGYALVQPFATAKNLALNGEMLMNLPLVWSYALALPRRTSARIGVAASGAAGMLLGTAFLLKQPAAIAAVPLGGYLLGARLWWPDLRWRRAVGQAAALTAGFAGVVGGAAAILWHYGLLSEAWYWTTADHGVPHVFWQHAAEHTALFLLFALPLALPLTAAAALRDAWRGREAELWTLLGWLAVSVIGAAAGGRFYPHYYIQIIPPLAVVAGVFHAQRDDAAAPRAPWLTLRFAGIWLAVAGLISLAVQTMQLRAEQIPSAAARYVHAQAGAGDRLFVWGQQTRFYVDAGLLPASRYIATFPLTGYIFGGPLPGVATRDRIVPGAWANLAADLRHHAPEFVIDTQPGPGDMYPIRQFPGLARFIAGDYQLVEAFADGVVYRRRQSGKPALQQPARARFGVFRAKSFK